ncbi:hypothetical protein HZC34_03370 [Candidatus Saganbacteria bacterium]|nr:hypothetical protein [Candidatus Saganbacteria bacterium]
MINIVDIVVAVLLMLYLLKNAGGGIKLVKNFLAVSLILVIFGILSQLLLSSPLNFPALKVISDSYSFKVSNLLVRVVYPPLKNSAPKIDKFISEKMIATPTPEVSVPTIKMDGLSLESMPKLSLPKPSITFK